MSKIRSENDLHDKLTAEFAWRKKELLGLKTIVLANENTGFRDLCVRAAIPLLYAHWEGFIMQVSSYYLEFVARKKLTNDELPSHFLARSIARILHEATESSKVKRSIEVVEFIRGQMSARSQMNWKSGVNTKSNLKSEVLEDIVLSLGLNYSNFATKQKLIDEQLLANRNSIAHGQYSLISLNEYISLQAEVLAMMQEFFNQIENAVTLTMYRRIRKSK